MEPSPSRLTSSISSRRSNFRPGLTEADFAGVSRVCLLTHPACQQDLRSCRTSTERDPSTIFLVFAIIHLGIAISLTLCGDESKSWSERYDDRCELSADKPTGRASVEFDLESVVEGRFFLYYELDGFRQNHFRLRRSYSGDQLLGKFVESPASCDPLAKRDNIPLFPCGLLPANFFNDSYTVDGGLFSEEGIAWENEIGRLYKEPDGRYPEEGRFLRGYEHFPNETLNEHFIVWMRLAKEGHFRKLWARALVESFGPKVSVDVRCDFPYTKFAGKRSLVLVRMGGLGGKNEFLGVANFILVGFCSFVVIIFKLRKGICAANTKQLHMAAYELPEEVIIPV